MEALLIEGVSLCKVTCHTKEMRLYATHGGSFRKNFEVKA